MSFGLRSARYPVADLAAAKRWYADVLGRSSSFGHTFYVGFAVGGFERGLLPGSCAGTDGAQRLRGVDGIDAAFARVVALGAAELEPVTEACEGIKVAAVRDSFGKRFGLIEKSQVDAKALR